jgi:arylsulfatase A-like enzyme
MRKNLTLFCGAAAPLLWCGAAVDPPNFIVILIDDMGWADSSTYGSDYYETPNLTRLAKEGMLFTDAYAAAPLCSPTRASILSGQYPARLRMTVAITSKDVPVPKALPPEGDKYCGLVENRNYMPLEIITLAERLKVSGYQTAHIGKWHLSPSGKQWKETGDQYNAEHQGFDFVIGGDHLPGPPDYYSPYKNGIRNLSPRPAGEYLNERLAQESIKWITSVKDSGKPFYLNFWHYAVHGPIIPKKDLLPKYVERRDPKKNQRCPEMGTMLESMDLSIGILLDWLDQPENRSVKENTVILLTSDNGGVIHNEINGNPWTSNRPLRGGKANLYEGGVRVPWIVRWPGNIQAGTVCKTPVQSVDVYPTVLEIAGLKPSPETLLDGQSFVPLLKGKTMDRQPVFTHFPHLFGILCAPSTSVRAGDYKLIRYHHAGENAASPAYELFDLKRDPYESVNLAGYMPDKVAELDLLIEQFLKKTDALVPLRNPAFAGNPQTPRSNAQQAPDRPQSLRLAETEMVTGEAGRRILQLTDERNRPCKTHALVLEGSGWVRTETRPDGRVEVIWDTPPANAAARVLFGWCGGATAFEVNDWTHLPCELVIRSAAGTNKN